MYEKSAKAATKITPPLGGEKQDEEADLSELLLTEIVDQKLKQGVIGLGFRNESNPDYKLRSDGRPQYIHNNVRHYSPKWPEELAFQAFNQVYWRIQRQSRWYSGWSTIWGPATWCCYQYDLFGIDGPYQVRIEVSYDYSSDYYYEWFNW